MGRITQDYVLKNVRAQAVLTTSYVAGTVLENCQDYNQLILLIDFTKGSLTSAQVKVETAPEYRYTLGYDGQTANFTVGSTVKGGNSGATALIELDSDSGATGTLTLRQVSGVFQDNEALTDVAGGAAVVNGTLTDATQWYQEIASSVSGGTSTDTEVEHSFAPTSAAKYRVPVAVNDRYIKISAKGTGTVTNSLLKIDAALGVN